MSKHFVIVCYVNGNVARVECLTAEEAVQEFRRIAEEEIAMTATLFTEGRYANAYVNGGL